MELINKPYVIVKAQHTNELEDAVAQYIMVGYAPVGGIAFEDCQARQAVYKESWATKQPNLKQAKSNK